METLSNKEKEILNIIQGKTLTILSKELKVSKSAITNQLSKLIQKGLIYKEWDKQERRYYKYKHKTYVCPKCGKVI